MALEFTAVVQAGKKVYSDGYSYHQLSEKAFDGFIDPILSLEHFRMSEKPFGVRPYAGYCAVTYVFTGSPGGLLHRDSLGGRTEIRPGSMGWTVAGKGLLFEESLLGPEAQGIQLAVNLRSDLKKMEPRSLHLAADEVPIWQPSSAVRGRVLVGRQGGVVSPVETPEPFSFVDLEVRALASCLPRLSPESGALVYPLSGRVRVSEGESVRVLEPFQALGMRSDEKPAEVLIEALEDSRFLFLSGPQLREPIVAHGTLVMNTRAQISETIEAFQKGQCGRLT